MLKNDPQEIIVKVEPPQKEEVVAPAPVEVTAEGEVPEEGEEIPAEEEVQAPSEEPQKEKSS